MMHRLPPTLQAPARAIVAAFVIGALPCLSATQAFAQTNRAPAAKVTPKPAPDAAEEWDGVYFGNKKIGYNVSRTDPTIYLSKPALRESTHGVIKLTMLGASIQEDEDSVSITDPDHRLLMQTVDVKSNGGALHLEAVYKYDEHKIYCTVGTGPSASHKTLEMPKGATFAADPSTLTAGKELTAGQSLEFYYLRPLNVDIQKATVEVKNKTTVKDDSGKSVPAFELIANLSDGKMAGWADKNGNLIRSELALGKLTMTTVRETHDHALDTAYITPALAADIAAADPLPGDFADATALKPDRTLPDARAMTYLKVTISGVPEQNLVPSDDRQACVRSGKARADGVTADYTIRAERFAAADASKWPVRGAAFTPYLGSATFLETDDVPIQKTARRLRGNDTNLYIIASNIRDWVHNVMTPDASIGVVRSAKDVYNRRRGVCRDYATLYTAIARAAGVPTRLCAGIVYSDGKFFYHAWAESYVGRWVAFDPTLFDASKAKYVDATHIKFAQGDVTQMFEVVSIVGRLKIHVVDSDPPAENAQSTAIIKPTS